MREIQFTTTIGMITETCCSCGMAFAMTREFHAARKAKPGSSFYCPAGHGQHYTGKSKEDQLAEHLSRERQRAARLEDEARIEREAREHADRRAAAARGQVTKLKKRAAAGVCPCCNRHFSDMARHMAQKHPGFVAEPVAGDNVVPIKAR